MDTSPDKTPRKHGGKALRSLPERRVTTSLTFESDSRIYLWTTERRLARR